jgi:hypothetical protein
MQYALTGTKLLIDLTDPDARALLKPLWLIIGTDDAYGDLRRALSTKVPAWRLLASDGTTAYMIAYDGPPHLAPERLPERVVGQVEAGLWIDRGSAWAPIDADEASDLFGDYALTYGWQKIEDFDRAAFIEATSV